MKSRSYLAEALGSAKEFLPYSLVRKSDQADYRVIVTKSGVGEVIKDARATV
jgi:hypothetical protein